MIGEFDFANIFFSYRQDTDKEYELKFPKSTYIIFTIFLIVMPIIVMNLLTGLAVDDVNKLREKAFLEVQRLRISLTLDLNAFNKKHEYLKFLFWLRGRFPRAARFLNYLMTCKCCSRKRAGNTKNLRKNSYELISLQRNMENLLGLPSVSESEVIEFNIKEERYLSVNIPTIYLFTSWAVDCKNFQSKPWWNHCFFFGLSTVISRNNGTSNEETNNENNLLETYDIEFSKTDKNQQFEKFQSLEEKFSQLESEFKAYQKKEEENFKEILKKIENNRILDFHFQTDILKEVKSLSNSLQEIKSSLRTS